MIRWVSGPTCEGDADAVLDATLEGAYPDGIVQIVTLAGSARAGDLIVSATPGWDFRARYEPIPHRSAHGALHRDHVMVPLLTNRPASGTPRRTTDVFASALDALGVAAPERMDGRSFLGRRLKVARLTPVPATQPGASRRTGRTGSWGAGDGHGAVRTLREDAHSRDISRMPTPSFKTHPDTGLLVLRLGLGAILLFHGIYKVTHGVAWIAGPLGKHGLPA